MRLKAGAKILVGAAALTLIVGCGEDGSLPFAKEEVEEELDKNEEDFSGSKGQIKQGVPQSARTDLFGLWSRGCDVEERKDHDEGPTDEPIDGESPADAVALMLQAAQEDPIMEGGEHEDDGMEFGSRMEEYEFRRGLRYRMVEFRDTECLDPIVEFEVHADYVIGDVRLEDESRGARDLDLFVRGGYVIIHDAELATEFSEYGMCGVSEWIAGERVNLADMDCNGDGPPAVGDVMYDIVKVENDHLFFGDEDNHHEEHHADEPMNDPTSDPADQDPAMPLVDPATEDLPDDGAMVDGDMNDVYKDDGRDGSSPESRIIKLSDRHSGTRIAD